MKPVRTEIVSLFVIQDGDKLLYLIKSPMGNEYVDAPFDKVITRLGEVAQFIEANLAIDRLKPG